MFYACLNMHLESRSIRNDTEAFFYLCLVIHETLREKAADFRANPCYHERRDPAPPTSTPPPATLVTL